MKTRLLYLNGLNVTRKIASLCYQTQKLDFKC